MEDKLVKATAKNGMVRIIGAVTTNLVNDGCRMHDTTPVASAAFGSMLKGEKEVTTLKINGGGEINGITVTAHNDCSVKGFIGNPYVDRPLNEKGKLDVGGAIGTNGILYVIKDLGLKDPYIGQVPIQTGEIGDDFAFYFTVSEQTPSAVSLGVLVDRDLSIKCAGGFIIQMMPDADELLADVITYRLQEVPPITTMINQGKTIEEILEFIFEGMDLKILESSTPHYKCDCSRERVEKALISIGKKELQELYDEGKGEEIVCNFCNKKYQFTKEDIGELLNRQ